MPSSANPDSSDRPALLNFVSGTEIASRGGVLHLPFPFPFPSPAAAAPELGAINRRPSQSSLSADAFSDFPSLAMPLGDRSLLREPIYRTSFDCASVSAPLPPASLRSPFSVDLFGREFAFFGNSVGNGTAHSDRDGDRCDDSAQGYCAVIPPTLLSEVREILRLSGGSCRIEDRLSIPSETESIGEMDFPSHRSVREVVFGANSGCRTISGFHGFTSLLRIEIPSSVEVIHRTAFYRCTQLSEVIFEANSQIQEIHGFMNCTALARMVIPSSVELISMNAFYRCAQLSEVIFEANSHIREIHGFRNCTALARIDFPSSVELMTGTAFSRCAQLSEVIFEANSQLRAIAGFDFCTSLSRMVLPPSLQSISGLAFDGCAGPRVVEFPFGSRLQNNSRLRRCHCLIGYGDSDLKHSRRGLQMQLQLGFRLGF
jgi:hypothetical protein